MYEIVALRGDHPLSLHCLSAVSALCALYELSDELPGQDIVVRFEGIGLSAADLRRRALAESSGTH